MGNIRQSGLIIAFLVIIVLLSGCTALTGGETATLAFTSSPSGAEVYLDQQYRGTTPCTVSGVEPGGHALEFRLAGYDTWTSAVTVPAGESQYSAELSSSTGTVPVGTATEPGVTATAEPASLTLQASKDPMIVGDSMTFSGSSSGITEIVLTVYGTGYYADGVVVGSTKPNAAGLWSYTWKPGTAVLAGQYAVVAADKQGAVSKKLGFQVIGGGEVTVSLSNHAFSAGDTIGFSGRCSTGAPSVRLVLAGPGQYAGGVDIGTASVLGDNTWSFRYKLDITMPSGMYTVTVYDVPKTASYSDQFSLGYG